MICLNSAKSNFVRKALDSYVSRPIFPHTLIETSPFDAMALAMAVPLAMRRRQSSPDSTNLKDYWRHPRHG
jgi:hypothetical protein